MSEIRMQPVNEPSAWKGGEIASQPDWHYRLDAGEIAEIEAALASVRARGLAIGALGREDFPLPTLSRRMADWLRDILDGRGFVLVRGLPVERHAPADVRLMFVGLCTHFGTAISQNAYGELLGDVHDEGVTMASGARGYRTREQLWFHTDRSDIVGLLCFQKAKSGGISSIVSSMAIHNEILRTHPEYLPALYRGYLYMNVEEGGDRSQWRVPIFHQQDGVLSCRYSRNTIETSRGFGVELTALEEAALTYMDSLAADPAFRLDMDLTRGDMQFINSYTTLHSRTAYEDYADPALKRRMLRIWIRPAKRRPAGPHFSEYEGVAKKLDRRPAAQPSPVA